MKPTLTRIGTVVFLSGLCSLVYQVVWLRSLRMVFGSSTPATAAVLAIFMGGLGLGGYLFGRRVERAANPLALYGNLELGIASSAALSPLLIDLVRELYLAVGGSSTLGLSGATALRVALSATVLALPTVLMGGTLPAVAQAMERRSDLGRRIVAAFYGVNTLGAVVGALATTFVLIELVGVRRALWLACLLNLLLALVVRSWARSVESDSDKKGAEEEAGDAPGDERRRSRSQDAVLLGVAGLSGFLFFLMELVWYRMLAPVLGGSSFTFGLILALALAGIGTGGWLYSLGSEKRRPDLDSLALSLVLEALCLALPFALGDRLTFFASVLRDLQGGGFTALVLGWSLVAGLVVFPAALVAGYQFPLIVALFGSGRRRVGSELGKLYAWNTWGAVLGSLAGGFLLLPLLTAPRLWRLSALALAALGVALAVFGPRVALRPSREREGASPSPTPRGRRAGLVAGSAALCLLVALADGPTAFWRHTAVGAGRAEIEPAGPNELREAIHRTRRSVVREAEGVESSVALLIRGELALYVNGKSDGSARSDAPMQVMGGLVGGVLHPRPRRVLVIGLGTGMTAGWLAKVETVEHVDAVELEPAVADFSREFGAATFQVLDLPNVRIHYGDGREFVRTSSARYDVIFSEPSNPYRAGVADLFSREFYRAVADRLEPGGVFLHWLQGYEVDAEAVGTVYSTLTSAFPHVESWQVHSTDLLLVASAEPVVHDLDAIRRRVRREPFRSGLVRTWRVDGIEGLYSGFVAHHGLAEALASAAGSVSTDDRPVIEYAFARNMGRKGLFRVAELQALARRHGAERPPGRGTPLDWRRIDELRQVREAAGNFTRFAASPGIDEAGRARRAARVAYQEGDLAGAGRLWFSQTGPPLALFDRFLIAEALADRADPAAEAAVEDLRELAPTEADFLAGRLAWRRGEAAAAAGRLARAFEALREDPWAFRPIVERGLDLLPQVAAADRGAARRFFEALGEPFSGYLAEELRQLKRLELALMPGHGDLCVEAFAQFEPHVIWEKRFLARRLDCYESAAHPLARRARRQLAECLAREPPDLLAAPAVPVDQASAAGGQE